MSAEFLYLDKETRSPVDLRKHGAFIYWAHPLTDVLLLRYAFDDGPILGWRRGDPCPPAVREHIERGGKVSGWNVFGFERLGFENVMGPRYGWPVPKLEQYDDTMLTAVAMSLPRALGDAAEALDLPIRKDKEGARLIRKFSIPRKPRKGEDPNGIYWNEPEDHPEDFAHFDSYCGDDVGVERAAKKRLVPLSATEHAVTVMDARINARGVRIDRRSARAAMAAAEKAKKALDHEMRLATGGYVAACSQPGKLVEWVAAQGVELNSAAKAEVTELLERDDLPANVRRALEIRQEAAKTSVAKLKAMLDRAGADGRVRGGFMYHGASTGRWVSTGVNLANLPRPRRVYEDAHPRTDVLFSAFRQGDPELLPFLYGPELGRPLHLISDAIRGFLWAAPGHELVQADYSNVEGNVLAWLAGEEWKLRAVREINANPALPDMYRRTAASILGLTTDVVTKKHWARQAVGKPAELACFGPHTQILTDRGPVAITDVLLSDKLWDGEQWVAHKGVVAKGVRQAVRVDGIVLTPDHLIKLPRSWQPARKLVSSPSMLHRALAIGSASLQSLASHLEKTGAHVTLPCNALAAGRPITCSPATYERAPQRGALSVPAQRPGIRVKSSTAIAISYLTKTIGRGFLTGSMSTADTNPATFVSSRAARTHSTNENRKPCRSISRPSNAKLRTYVRVYDIAHAGPRNRFTIFSDSGALVVHNCGFGGSVPAFVTFARNAGVKLDPLAPTILAQADEDRIERATKRYESQAKLGKSGTDVLPRDTWIACHTVVQGWRAANPAITQSWKDMENAVRGAVASPGTITSAAKTEYLVKQGFLWARLPSGRCLAYGAPRLKAQVWAKIRLGPGEWSDAEVMDRDSAERGERLGDIKIEGNTSDKVTVLGVNAVTKKWQRYALYGGLCAENSTQATARDLLVNGMFKAEAAGYPIIATVYDEIISEVPRGYGSLKDFERMICELPDWAAGLPLVASGWRGKRYRKD